jgi:transcriptional regulator with XRE-family HTH domain
MKESKENFGTLLRRIREQAKESVDDVSGAVEVDVKLLSEIEAGKQNPSEDLVLLLISHFQMTDEEALKMWDLAGYKEPNSQKNMPIIQTAYINPSDAKIIYTDMVHINANKYGVVMDFLQGLDASSQSVAISRIGMSREHAISLLKILQKTLQASDNVQKTDKESKK